MNQTDSESGARKKKRCKNASLSETEAVQKNEETMKIGGRLKAARKRLQLTQATLAEQTGIPLTTLKGYELDQRTPGAEPIEYLVRRGINANWLLTGEGPMLLKDMEHEAAPPDVDPDTLTAVIEEMEQALERRHLYLAPAKKARAIGVLYDFCKKSGAQGPAVVERVLELMS
jgi:transcriptional regulator with XRE-family HTH domain